MSGRVEETVYKRIVYGNISRKLPEKLSNGHTHRWTVYVKPYNEEKISNYVRKVQFKLHSDYENAVRGMSIYASTIKPTSKIFQLLKRSLLK